MTTKMAAKVMAKVDICNGLIAGHLEVRIGLPRRGPSPIRKLQALHQRRTRHPMQAREQTAKRKIEKSDDGRPDAYILPLLQPRPCCKF